MNIGLIGLTGRHALDGGYHAVIEGIFYANHYGAMLAQLLAGRRLSLRGWSLPFAETLACHVAKRIACMVSRTQLRDWYRPRDLLPGGIETVFDAGSSLPETVDRIMLDSGLAGLSALEE
ncbi:hypothetical protein JW613_31125 [Streptomyces smyrnaeus]|uniref:Uncharacterized protein n=1 Tax=Streptomyces smyrnaeus TaxID=1387713 RepID=A0ABS3Y4W1_9ACTN|nr:hypothetical protein [Streptomyces smyrnaeus]MBO8202695.1 hypothetical protein [Streptomyces smyrnaeus]